jgi:GNAT superfamily N-acetyltransferase
VSTVAADGYEVDDDPTRLDLDLVHHWLSTDAYWALGRSRETVATAAEHSLNIAAYAPDGRQVAYARLVTDRATFAWLCDVYVDPGHRGRGLGSRLVEAVVARLEPMRLRRTLLATEDAHGIYARFGFTPLPHPERMMVREALPAES